MSAGWDRQGVAAGLRRFCESHARALAVLMLSDVYALSSSVFVLNLLVGFELS